MQGSCIWIIIWIREFSKEYFIYYCNLCRQARIKHINPWQRFKLSGCFLIVAVFIGLSVNVIDAREGGKGEHETESEGAAASATRGG